MYRLKYIFLTSIAFLGLAVAYNNCSRSSPIDDGSTSSSVDLLRQNGTSTSGNALTSYKFSAKGYAMATDLLAHKYCKSVTQCLGTSYEDCRDKVDKVSGLSSGICGGLPYCPQEATFRELFNLELAGKLAGDFEYATKFYKDLNCNLDDIKSFPVSGGEAFTRSLEDYWITSRRLLYAFDESGNIDISWSAELAKALSIPKIGLWNHLKEEYSLQIRSDVEISLSGLEKMPVSPGHSYSFRIYLKSSGRDPISLIRFNVIKRSENIDSPTTPITDADGNMYFESRFTIPSTWTDTYVKPSMVLKYSSQYVIKRVELIDDAISAPVFLDTFEQNPFDRWIIQ